VNAARLNGAANPQSMTPSAALQSRQLRNRVVIRLAFAVPKPSQKGHRHNDDPDSDPEFCPFLQQWHSCERNFAPGAILS
jgi:hypothetical protein